MVGAGVAGQWNVGQSAVGVDLSFVCHVIHNHHVIARPGVVLSRVSSALLLPRVYVTSHTYNRQITNFWAPERASVAQHVF